MPLTTPHQTAPAQWRVFFRRPWSSAIRRSTAMRQDVRLCLYRSLLSPSRHSRRAVRGDAEQASRARATHWLHEAGRLRRRCPSESPCALVRRAGCLLPFRRGFRPAAVLPAPFVPQQAHQYTNRITLLSPYSNHTFIFVPCDAIDNTISSPSELIARVVPANRSAASDRQLSHRPPPSPQSLYPLHRELRPRMH